MDDSTYDIVAKLDHAFMPEDATPKLLSDATMLALQALLADRFQLKFHHVENGSDDRAQMRIIVGRLQEGLVPNVANAVLLRSEADASISNE